MKEFHRYLQAIRLVFATDVTCELALDTMALEAKNAPRELAKAIQMLDHLPGLDVTCPTSQGHTDSKAGSVRNAKGQMERFDNQALPEKRANDMRVILIVRGASPHRIVAVEHRASQPVGPNEINVGGRSIDNAEGRALNRRSECTFSLTEVECKACLREMVARFVRESVADVTKGTTVIAPRLAVDHL